MPRLVCPVCHGHLSEQWFCSHCSLDFPVVGEVPILLNEPNSVFRFADYQQHRAYEGASGYAGSVDRTTGWRRLYRRFATRLKEAPIPGVRFDPKPWIQRERPDADILVIGSGECQLDFGRVVYTDVALARGISCVCDGHDLPFEDGSFDVVYAVAVLEHVCDPQRVVAEITRVLRPGGIVFAVTPFLQPVHMGAYDFTRFTHLGHRRLFRQYDELESGMSGGPIYSGIHLVRGLLPAMTNHHRLRSALRFLALLITHPLRYLDPLFSRTQSAYNAACACYFLGRKRSTAISDRELIGLFRGI